MTLSLSKLVNSLMVKSESKNSDGSFLIDEKGKISVSLIYDGVWSCSEGLGGVKQDDKWGFINKQGVSPYPPPEF